MNRLKDLREEKDLTQQEIGSILNIARSTYAEYEIERREISITSLITLADYYKTSIDYILYRTDDRRNYKKTNIIPTKNFNRIKELRNKTNKSQKETALELSIPKSTYIKYEQKLISINNTLLHIFADYFNTSIDYIVGITCELTPHKKSIVDWK